MTEAVLYLLGYIAPAMFLTIVGILLFTYAHNEKTSRFVAGSMLCYALVFLLEALRLGSTAEWHVIFFKSALLVTFVGVSLHLHSLYYIITKQKKLSWPLAPFLFYVPAVALLIYAFFETRVMESAGIYSAMVSFEFLSTLVCTSYTVFFLYLLMIGYKHAVIQDSKNMFRFLFFMTSAILVIYGILRLLVGEWHYASFMHVVVVASIGALLMAIALVKYKMIRRFTKKYKQMLDFIPVMVATFDERLNLKEANALALQNFPLLQERRNFYDIWQTEEQTRQARKMMVKLEQEKSLKEYAIKFKNDATEEIHFEIDATIILEGYEKVYYFMIRDVTRVELQERQNYYLAYHDQLTGLYNRAYFVPQVMSTLENKQKFVLLLSDLNFFKQINDTYGHAVGDDVLKFTANLLKESVGDYCILARLGGDEFIMCFSQIASEYHFKQRLEKIRQAFQTNYFVLGDLVIEVIPSFGYAVYPEDGIEFEELYHFADVKMYEDKRAIKAARQLD